MTEKEYEYDLAFSFAQKDESLALSIYQLLKDRLKCFIYSEEQKKLAGTDGEETFNKVFSEQSRIVVIFLSKDWGNTKWTRIEETAIKNKGFEEGYDFVILIPTEKVTAPKYIPKTRLWIGLERWGVDSAASVIEARVQEFGGDVKELTVTEKLALADADIRKKRENGQFLLTVEGYKAGEAEFQKLNKEIIDLINEAKEKASGWHFQVIQNVRQGINVLSYNHSLTLQWYGDYAFNTITGGYVDRHLQRSDPFYDYKNILADRKVFDINALGQYGWTDQESRKNFMLTKKLAEKYFQKLFQLGEKYRRENNL